MKHLFLLASNFTPVVNDRLLGVANKHASQIKLVFIENAADQNREQGADLSYIDRERGQLESFGYKLDKLDLRDYLNKPDELEVELSKYDVAFFTGGNCHLLLDYFYKTGLVNTYSKLLENGLIHVGSSAGAMIFSTTMKYYNGYFDKEYDGEKHERGLGFFPHYIVPHYASKPKCTKIFEDLIKQFENETVHFIPLTNDQGVYVQDEKWEIL